MAKILFINPSLIYGNWMHMGIASLSAYLKEHGHKVQLYDAGKKVKRDWVAYAYSDEDNMINHIKKFRPDVIGITSMTSNFKFVVHLAGIIKKFFDTPIILGGPHPTTNPDICIAEKDIDMICVGEGEEAILELMTKIDNGEKTDKIRNIWTKKNGDVIKNPLRPLIKKLDDLPFPDRELFDSDDKEQFMTGRGCPYSCTYCINHRLVRLYPGQPFVRYRSIDNVFDEIRKIDRKKRIDKVAFIDETFTLDKKRVIEFCDRYEDEVGIPFTVQTRANTMDKEIAEHLKKAGCYMALIGIESGNDKIRNNTMKRNMSKQQIVNAFDVIRNAGIHTFSFNIIGVPGETRSTFLETINFNKEIGVNKMQFTIFFPFRGTDLGDMCFENGYVKEEPERDYFVKSFLNLPTMSGKMIDSYISTAPLYYKLPKSMYYFADMVRYMLYPMPINYKRYPRALIKRMFPIDKEIKVPERKD
jgi:anaerobic magnesium-protoporphyrin IX monomethyl ester cyclase